MDMNGYQRAVRTAGVSVVLAALLVTGPTILAQGTYLEMMRFAADMAKRGNSLEALGDEAAARASYERASTLMRGNTVIETNRVRAERFWSQVRQAGDGDVPTYNRHGLIPGDPAEVGKKKKKGKSFKVSVALPVPARLDLEGRKTLLVASFRTDESHLLDINRELVRFIRSEYRKHTKLEILPIAPPPAVPEQTLADMIANHEFWKFLGGEYGADVIVSGVMKYDRRDSSGFQDVDVISPATGQKVRQSQFVEQERFSYELDIIFMDGMTGQLLFQDRVQRSAVFRGTQNDPISAFYELSESIAPDVLAIIRPRTRQDVRFVFKK
jgi:hypothetical protein